MYFRRIFLRPAGRRTRQTAAGAARRIRRTWPRQDYHQGLALICSKSLFGDFDLAVVEDDVFEFAAGFFEVGVFRFRGDVHVLKRYVADYRFLGMSGFASVTEIKEFPAFHVETVECYVMDVGASRVPGIRTYETDADVGVVFCEAEFLADVVADDVVAFFLYELSDLLAFQAKCEKAAVSDFPIGQPFLFENGNEFRMILLENYLC